MRARKGVVLASGGFARDPERLKRIDPRFGDVMATSGAGHTGDGHRWAEALGAGMRARPPVTGRGRGASVAT